MPTSPVANWSRFGLAEPHRAGRDQARDHAGRCVGDVTEGRAGRGGRHAGDVDVVLDGERYAEQRMALQQRGPLAAGGGQAVECGQRGLEPGMVDRVDPGRRLGRLSTCAAGPQQYAVVCALRDGLEPFPHGSRDRAM